MIADNMLSFFDPIKDELFLVEDILSSKMNSDIKTVVDVSSHLINSGGKRLRPALVLLSGRLCDAIDFDKIIKIAASIEMIHMAALMHDDIVDNSESRRGNETVNHRWGNQVSVLSGDFVVAKAFSLLSENKNESVMNLIAESAIQMAESELLQIESQNNIKALSELYFQIIKGKTAVFMSSACKAAAISAEANSDYINKLGSYGMNLGMAFQITDDLLDLVGDPAITGKPVGSDIREGKLTLPVILALEYAEQADAVKIEEIVLSRNASKNDISFIKHIADITGAIDGSLETAARYTKQAIGDLDCFNNNEYRNSLKELATFILSRDK